MWAASDLGTTPVTETDPDGLTSIPSTPNPVAMVVAVVTSSLPVPYEFDAPVGISSRHRGPNFANCFAKWDGLDKIPNWQVQLKPMVELKPMAKGDSVQVEAYRILQSNPILIPN